MRKLFIFRKAYFLLTITLFCIEVLIAVFVDDKIIRPYVGDVLVVILVYCFLRTFLNINKLYLAVFALLFAYFVEGLQYLNLLQLLQLQHSRLAKTVLGSSFEWTDIFAYTLGFAIILCVEYRRRWPGNKKDIKA